MIKFIQWLENNNITKFAPLKYTFYKNTEYVPIEIAKKLIAIPPLRHESKYLEKLIADIEKYGYEEPIHIGEFYQPKNKLYYVTNGAHRLSAAILAKHTHVPIYMATFDFGIGEALPEEFHGIPVQNMPKMSINNVPSNHKNWSTRQYE